MAARKRPNKVALMDDGMLRVVKNPGDLSTLGHGRSIVRFTHFSPAPAPLPKDPITLSATHHCACALGADLRARVGGSLSGQSTVDL